MSARTYAGTRELLLAALIGALAVVFAWAAIFAISANPAQATDAHDVADRFGITIVWTDENCGAALSEVGKGGCFSPRTPDVIYVSPGTPSHAQEHVILHEIGHALHHRLGLPQDECAADQFAQSMGSPYTPNC